MELEFARARKLQDKEKAIREKSRQEKASLEAKTRDEIAKAEAIRQVQRKEKLTIEAKRAARLEEESYNSGGTPFAVQLQPLPLSDLETDKIRLPASVLSSLINLGAIQDSRPLTFELSIISPEEEVLGRTTVGVWEFTAKEGTVEIPVKSVLSLTKNEPDLLQRFKVIRVRLVVLDAHAKVRVSFQPQGEGFHLNDAQVVNMDLKSVLTRALKFQTALSLHDWIPLRHEGRTYVLKVRALEPESPVLLIDTDVEVNLLPCEVEEERVESNKRRVVEAETRLRHAQQLASSLPHEPSSGGVLFKARLPDGSQGKRRFDPNTSRVCDVFDWATSLSGHLEPPHVNAHLEMSVGGRETVLVPPSSDFLSQIPPLNQSGQLLVFRWAKEAPQQEKVLPSPQTVAAAATAEWVTSMKTAESQLDQRLEELNSKEMEEEESGGSATDMFKLLVSLGANPTRAAHLSQRYFPCLVTLKSMSLLTSAGSGEVVLDLVEKYKGSTARVADALMMIMTPPSKENNSELDTLQAMFADRNREELADILEQHMGSLEKAANHLLQQTNVC